MKIFSVLIILTAFASCSKSWGDSSLGNHLSLIHGDTDQDKRIVYCADETKPCSEGLTLIANVDDLRSNNDWIIARSIKDKQEIYWIINKDFSLGDKDCAKADCGNYIKTFVNGPLTLEEFDGTRDELEIKLEFPKTK